MGVAGASGQSGGRQSEGTSTANSGGATVSGTHSFDIPSQYPAAQPIQKQILDDVVRLGYTAQNQFAIKISLEEALINAIKHGNKLDAKKRVRVQASVTEALLEITIEDEGPGFDRSSVPDPTDLENLEKCSGRGILLMESYMDSVEWSNNGRRVRMTKRNTPDVHPRR